jgi:superoxide reductase
MDNISRRQLLGTAAVAGATLAMGTFSTAHAAETPGVKLGSTIKSADFKTEKHVPVIDAPASVKTGEAFTVTVSIGKEVPHPNTTEHFISWIALYFKPAAGGSVSELGKYEFTAHGESTLGANKGNVYADPSAAVRLRLNASGTLVALSYCNIHGLWESSKEITAA